LNHVILIHGYPDSPYTLRSLGEYLTVNGFHVFAPLLPGFGKNFEYLYEHSSWKEWVETIDNLIDRVKKEGSKNIFVSGHSMGGFLTLYTAIYHPEIKALAPICGPVYVKSVLKYIVPIMAIFKKYVTDAQGDMIDVIDPSLFKDPIFQELRKHYDKVVFKAVNSELKLMKMVRKHLQEITQPILICQSQKDKTVPLDTPDYIHDRVSSQEKEIKWYENSGHYITFDNDKEKLFADISAFFKKHI